MRKYRVFLKGAPEQIVEATFAQMIGSQNSVASFQFTLKDETGTRVVAMFTTDSCIGYVEVK